ncbi:MAG: glycosyltransferase N-terminal domain-containing protein [Isosphaeraceae bacterium]
MAIVNGRLSVRSHRGYRKLRGPLGPTLRRLDAVAVQTEEYVNKFVDPASDPCRVHVTGSVKYDGLESDRNNPRTPELRRSLGPRGRDLGARGGKHDGGRGGRRLRLPCRPGRAPRPATCDRPATRSDSRRLPRGWSRRRTSPPEEQATTAAASRRIAPVILVDSIGEAPGRLGPGRRGLRRRQPPAGTGGRT